MENIKKPDKCKKCGAKISKNKNFCTQCGEPIEHIAHTLKGDEYVIKGMLNEAIKEYEIAIKLNPDNFVAQNNLGTIFKDIGRLNEAILHSKEALRIDPNSFIPHNNLGGALKEKGLFDEAIKEFKEALRLDPDSPDAHSNLGATYRAIGLDEEAIKEYEEAIRINPDFYMAHMNLGNIIGIKGKIEEAIKEFKEVIRIKPDFPLVYMNMGFFFESIGSDSSALEAYQNCLKYKTPQFEQHIPTVEERIREINEATLDEDFKRLTKKAISTADEWEKEGFNFLEAGKYRVALRCFDEALKLEPNNAEMWANKGTTLGMLEKIEGAILCLDKSLKIDPKRVNTWNNKAMAMINFGKSEEAIKCCDESLKIDNTNAHTFFLKALAYKNLNDIQNAIHFYDKSLKLDPNDPTSWYNKGNVYFDIEKFEKAIECYDKVLYIDPNHRGAIANKKLAQNNRSKIPKNFKKKSPTIKIESMNIEELMERILELESIGQFEKAIDMCDQVLNVNPTDGSAQFFKGKALVALADFERAMIHFQKAQQFGIRSPSLMLYSITIRANLEKMKIPDFSPDYIRQIEVKPIGFFANEESWNIQGATLQMLAQYEESYKCYEKSLDINPNYVQALKNKNRLISIFKQSKCPKCGQEVEPKDRFCMNCGYKFK